MNLRASLAQNLAAGNYFKIKIQLEVRLEIKNDPGNVLGAIESPARHLLDEASNFRLQGASQATWSNFLTSISAP